MSSSFGQWDLAGFAKSASYWYRAQWLASVKTADPGRPVLPPTHVVRVSQAWNKPPWSNATLNSIEVFSDLPLVELLLNGKSLGTAPCAAFGFAVFSAVKYAPGNLTAVGRQTAGGASLAVHTQLTPGAAAAIVLSLDAPSIATGTGSALLLDGHDAGLVRASVVDAAGLTVDASCVITFNVTAGPGRVVGVHNGDAASHEPQVASSRSAYHGLARAVVKVSADAASVAADALKMLAGQVEIGCGDRCSTELWTRADVAAAPPSITVTASSPGLPTATVEIPVSMEAAAHSVLATAAAAARAGTALTFD